jgi:hypothetical protein
MEVYHIKIQEGEGTEGWLIDCFKTNKGYQDSLVIVMTKLRGRRQRSRGWI